MNRGFCRLMTAVSLCLLPAGCGAKNAPVATLAGSTADDPRLTYATPYKNVRPEVKYVGDKVCAECHAEQSESYRHHPMGRSLAPAMGWAGRERFDAAARNPFTADGFEFRVDRRGNKLLHRARRRDAKGEIVAELDADISYVVGSGEHGYSYLIDHDGYLFQSPLTWYTQKQAWDLSPGFTADMHADRQITVGCVFCHSNQATAVPDTINRYRTPVFRGYAIGCERCHGPGELHVAGREAGAAPADVDYTIVNPRRLAPALRDAICEQCHLSGDARIPRRGREEFDFRPGLPLYLFSSVFVRRPGLGDDPKAVHHVQQMIESRCYQASAGALGCISCHDPHTMPAPEKKAEFFRNQCMICHRDKGCSLSPILRREKQNDCAACHLPPVASSDIAHTAFTDHRILRQPKHAGEGAGQLRLIRPGEIPIVHFHETILDLPQEEVRRDRGVALVILARRYPSVQQTLVQLSLPLLDEAVQTWPDDALAAESRAFALWRAGEPGKGLTAFKDLLARHPQREAALLDAAALCAGLGQNDDAIAFMQRALKIDPWTAPYHHQLAALLAGKGNWTESLAECRAVLRLNPAGPETRLLLVKCLLQTGERGRAGTEFEKLLALGVRDPEKLRKWFTEQIR